MPDRLPRRRGRLFVKLLFALWAGMLASILLTMAVLLLMGYGMPKEDGMPLLGGWVPVVPVAMGGLTTLVTAVALAWYLVEPVRHLRWALSRIAGGQFDTRVRPLMAGRSDEIADLALDVDRTAERLQRLIQSRRALMHDISHALRSPLARLQAAIGLWRQEPGSTDDMVRRVERESQRLDALIDELLTLSRVSSAALPVMSERVDVIELLHAIAEDADLEARAAGLRVEIDAPGHFVAELDGELIYRSYENVIRNAVKFSPAGSRIDIVVRIDEQHRVLRTEVLDRGPGVPEDMLEAIFEPFTRVAGSEEVRGSGLGLALARRAFTLHGGAIDAALREGGGLAVTVLLPAVRPPMAWSAA